MSADRAAKLAQLSRKIFGQVVNPPQVRSPSKVLRKALVADSLLSYYPKHYVAGPEIIKTLRRGGLYTDVRHEWRETINAMRRARGKGPPKKGEAGGGKKKKK